MSLVNILTDPDNILTAFVAAITFATIVTLVSPMLKGDKLEGRLKSVANRREELRKRNRAALANKGAPVPV